MNDERPQPLPLQRMDRVPPPLWPNGDGAYCPRCGARLVWTGEKYTQGYSRFTGAPIVYERIACPHHGHWLSHGFGHYSEWYVRRPG